MSYAENRAPVWPEVHRDEDSAAFFDAAADGTLLVRRGPGGMMLGPEARTCPETGSAVWEQVPASGRAALVTWATVHRAPLPILASSVPYVSAVVELAEGPWLMVRLIDVDGVELRAGLPVEVVFVQSGSADDQPGNETLPVFRPSAPIEGA